MPCNVTRLLCRPQGLAKCHCRSLRLSNARSYASQATEEDLEDDKPAAKARTYQDDLHLLRVLDQKSLRETTRQTSDLIQQIKDLEKHVASIPTTVQTNPKIPAYVNGSLRVKTQEDIPRAAKPAIAKAENVKAHLRDLQFAEYVNKNDIAMVEFEKEVQSWTDEEKEEKLRNWLYEGEATAARLRAISRKLLDDVTGMRNRTKQTAPPAFEQQKTSSAPAIGSSQAAGWKDATVTDAKKRAKDKPQTVIDLESLQRQLQATVAGQDKK